MCFALHVLQCCTPNCCTPNVLYGPGPQSAIYSAHKEPFKYRQEVCWVGTVLSPTTAGWSHLLAVRTDLQSHWAEHNTVQLGTVRTNCFCLFKVNVPSCFNHLSALELAVKYKTHIDTVMAFRQKYLAGIGCQESLKKFVQFTEQVRHFECPLWASWSPPPFSSATYWLFPPLPPPQLTIPPPPPPLQLTIPPLLPFS